MCLGRDLYTEDLFMQFDVNVVVNVHQCDSDVLKKLVSIERKLDLIMALVDDLKAGIAELDAETTLVATRIDALVKKLTDGSLNEAQKAEVIASLSAETARLKTLAVDPDVPVPPVPEPLMQARRI
jgi:hypothetical protein